MSDTVEQEKPSYEQMTVAEMRTECERQGLSKSGIRQDLLDRLKKKAYETMTLSAMKAELDRRGLAKAGSKQDLIDRLKMSTLKGVALADMTAEQIRNECRERGEMVRGTKKELSERMECWIVEQNKQEYGEAARTRVEKRRWRVLRNKKVWVYLPKRGRGRGQPAN